jgi:outer membrane lipoprotein SlyB
MKKIICVLAVVAGIELTACTPNISPDVVSASGANQVQNAEEGTVISKRAVTVKPNNTAVGTLTGAGLGAIGGSQIGGGDTRYATGLIGAVAGGLAGSMIQDKLTTQKGIEYVVKLDQQESGSTTMTTTGTTTSATSKKQSTSTTVVSGKSAPKRYVTVTQAQGDQEIKVGQRVLVEGIGTSHARIIVIS